jgi:hypothetical protein
MNVATKFPPGPTHKIPGKLLRQFVRDPINTLSNIAREYGYLISNWDVNMSI